METVFSKVGTLIEHSVRVNHDSKVRSPNIVGGVYYVVQFEDTNDRIEFLSTSKLLYGDKILVEIIKDKYGEYFCSHISTDKFGIRSAELVGKENEHEIVFNDLKIDTKDFIRELSDYENRFNLEIKIVE